MKKDRKTFPEMVSISRELAPGDTSWETGSMFPDLHTQET